MLAGVLVMTGMILGLYYFARGRAVCPPQGRLPWDQMNTDAVVHTISRGWSAPGLQLYRRNPGDS